MSVQIGTPVRPPTRRHSTSARPIVLAGTLLGSLFVAALAMAAPAGALPSGCTAVGSTVTCAYVFSGAQQTFVVPTGVTTLDATAIGAAGASGDTVGGSGAVATAALTVTSGATLFVVVGGTATTGSCLSASVDCVGGFNGGGRLGPRMTVVAAVGPPTSTSTGSLSSRLLVARVVRLKGGDPFVFGRGGEEALSLAAAGIAFRIVPGISAGIGGTAAAGIPLTHRRLARSVAFATGHDSSGELADVDWAALSRGSEVLVFYMAQRRIGQIAERLIAAGRDPSEPVALISNATCPDQSVSISTLAAAAADIANVPAGAPTLILVGPTIALRPLLAEHQQIEPMTVAIPNAQPGETAPVRAHG